MLENLHPEETTTLILVFFNNNRIAVEVNMSVANQYTRVFIANAKAQITVDMLNFAIFGSRVLVRSREQ